MKINNKFLLILLVLLSPVAARSSVKLDFTTVDMLTLRLYQEKKWDQHGCSGLIICVFIPKIFQ